MPCVHAGSVVPWCRAVLGCALVASCASSPAAAPPALRETAPIRLAFVGDVMLGRSVGAVVAGDPSTVFERLRPMLVDADLAFANLESPLTRRPHLYGEFALEADPAAADLLAGAGFDVLGVANNHATDGGPETVLDTLAALESAGVVGVGGGATHVEAAAPVILEVGGVRIGVAAFDLAGGQPATATTAGVNAWDADHAEETVTELRQSVDVVVVGLHGGVEYLPRPDPVLDHIVGLLADWGADVVWGHGAHVSYPVEVRAGSLRTAVVAPGLGNALFDQRLPATKVGAALEVLVDRDGVVAMRTGPVTIDAGRSSFEGWDEPLGDAVALDGDWWTPVRPWTADAADLDAIPNRATSPLPTMNVEVARSHGDVTATGETDLVIAFRRPLQDEPIHGVFPGVAWADELGRSAHIAVFTDTGRMRWGSAFMFEPVGEIAVCDGALALGFTTLDDPAVVAGGAWFWDGFGFRTTPTLPGTALATCADVDHDGDTDPVLTERTSANTPID
jgi:poly-gamma-glutamate capsule biosynthesis protein CapA/YwtB (metallophosphatase superfamily)